MASRQIFIISPRNISYSCDSALSVVQNGHAVGGERTSDQACPRKRGTGTRPASVDQVAAHDVWAVSQSPFSFAFGSALALPKEVLTWLAHGKWGQAPGPHRLTKLPRMNWGP
jgi:hypothetical protein